jgi:NADPH-dependent 2,4-dienoyl-CoA reductase/sulfur reductase-like enzyme
LLFERPGLAAGQKSRFEADMVVHAAGRTPEIDDMNLDLARVAWDERGVKVNEYLQSVSNPAVYAAGDAAASGGPPLTPVAEYEGAIVASNLLKGNHQKPNYTGIPTVVFTIPPVASVRLTEIEAREQGLKFRVKKEMTSTWYSCRRVAEKYSGHKVLVEEGTDRILGAHLLGDQATELVDRPNKRLHHRYEWARMCVATLVEAGTLLCSQGLNGVDGCRAAGGQIAGEPGSRHKSDRCHAIGNWINWPHVEEQRRQQPHGDDSCEKAARYTDAGQQ